MSVFNSAEQEFVYLRTYSRWLEEEGRRENFDESVERFINFLISERGDKIPKKVIKKIREYMLRLEVMPSMRAFWTAGKPAKLQNTCLYNCSFLVIDSIKAFAETLLILCCGTGVGFSCEEKYTSKLPSIKKFTAVNEQPHIVDDSKEGWSSSIELLMNALYNGKDQPFDYSKLRPKGTRLKTFGGRSSGPVPLITLHNYIREVFSKAQGRKLTTLEVHDIMCQIAEIVVSGGVRRSSLISLSSLDDKLLKNAKNGSFPLRRYMANNSAVYYEKPSAVDFLEEWTNLAKSGSGERGVINLSNMDKRTTDRRDGNLIAGTNPSLRAGTRVWTKEYGMIPIDELEDKTFTVKGLNGNLCDAKCWLSSPNAELYKIKLKNGFEYYATAEHKWPVMTADGYTKKTTVELVAGMKLPRLTEQDLISYKDAGTYDEGRLVGYFYGDGWITDRTDNNKRQYGVVVPNNVDRKKPYKKMFENFFNGKGCVRKHGVEFNSVSKRVDGFFRSFGVDKKEKGLPEFIFREASNAFINGFIQGYFDADGHISKDRRHSISSKDRKLIKDFQELLGFKGRYYSYTYTERDGYVGANKKYYNKKVDIHAIRRNISKIGTESNTQIESIEKTSLKEPVWDISVDDEHHCFQLSGVTTGNCGEILLRNMQFCNLSEVVVRETDDLDDLMDKIETATWIGVIQSTFTHFPNLRKKWKQNCDEERLLGVSLTGQMDNVELMTPDNFKALKKKAIKIAKKASKILDINMPASITCTKPSGSVSQLVNSASGCHPRFSPYYIRRYRISANDPLCQMLKDQGLTMTPEVGQRQHEMKNWSEDKVNTWVIDFPIKSPEKAVFRDQMTALEQLEYYKKLQQNYIEHNTSITVYVKDDEWFSVGDWVYKNWDYISGVSFLPYDGGSYELAPYEEITKEQYENMANNFPIIDYSQLSKYEMEDNTEGAKTLACGGGSCELK